MQSFMSGAKIVGRSVVEISFGCSYLSLCLHVLKVESLTSRGFSNEAHFR